MAARAERLTSAEIKALVEYDQRYLHCRTFGHSWVEVSVKKPPRGKVVGLVHMILQCSSCRTKRFDQISLLTGALFERYYEYPENYLREGRTSRNDYRLALVKKVLQKGK